VVRAVIIVFLALIAAGSKEYPGDYNLFFIDRNRNPDVIMYDINLDSQGKLDATKPISIYWNRKNNNDQTDALTGIQNKFGYGLKFQRISEYSADFKFVSYFNRSFELRKSGNDKYRVYTYSDGKKVEVQNMYIHFENDSFWFPAITKIELIGIEPNKGSQVKEIIIP
jgi:hypothetical protein